MFLFRITQGPFDPEVIQSEFSIEDPEIKVVHLKIYFLITVRNLKSLILFYHNVLFQNIVLG